MRNNYSIKYIRGTLLILGIWPDEHKLEKKFPFLCYRYFVPLALIIFLMIIPQTVNLFIIYNNLVLVTENLTIANLAALLTCLKYFFVISNRKALNELLGYYKEDWKHMKGKEETEIMVRCANISERISITCVLFMQGAVSLKMIQQCIGIILVEIRGLERFFVVQSWFPPFVKVTPYYHLVSITQVVTVYCVGISYTSIDCLIFMLVFHICAQFQILRRSLKQAINHRSENSQDDGSFREAIRIIVKKHEHLNYFAKTVEDSFNFCILLQVLVSTLLICFQGFLVFKEILNSESFPLNEISFLLFYVADVASFLYFFCYMGELLTNSSAGMRNAIFESDWQKLSSKDIKMLMFIIFRTRRPLQMTAGKFTVLSMETYSRILKAALGYLSVMVHMYSE
ncbi:odorant receptor 13a-like isoform X2 [Prorops nasuta]|uniref:odorant receptor 13a-like isoform X2 n=1 Tax=Prorops nasuta TaxID=863751 RepID=UPI0034CF34CF